MTRAYSQDLRNRVIDAVVVEGMSRHGGALRFGVSAASALKWVRHYERSGSRTKRGTGGQRPLPPRGGTGNGYWRW
jgi:transposase